VRQPASVRIAIRDFALGLPGEWLRVKLTTSNLLALAQPRTKPSGHGPGKAGWVSVDLTESDLPVEALEDWVVQSFRTVAPKKLVAELERGAREAP
jgi:predicted DNA-binding protein (MmcQ/YjbR family)